MLDPIGCFLPSSRARISRQSSTRQCAISRSSPRTATPTRAGLPRTRPFPIQRRSSSSPTTTSSACSTRRASRSSRSASRRLDGKQHADPREVWRIFAKNYYLFRGTPTRLWLDYALEHQFGLTRASQPDNADEYYDVIAASSQRRSSARAHSSKNSTSKCSPPPTRRSTRSSTTRRSASPAGRAASCPPSVPTPSSMPSTPASARTSRSSARSPAKTSARYKGYLNALRNRREFFKSMGATATDHGHLTAQTADLDPQHGRVALPAAYSPAGRCPRSRRSSAPRCSPKWPA